jgi:lysophospholipase L1-like esterase
VIGVSDYPTALRQLLIAKGYNATPGVIMPFHNVSGGDARWASQWGGGAVNAAFSSTTTAGLTTTLTSDVVGTIVEIYSFGTGRPFTYSIDGGAAVAFAPNGQSAVQKITVTGLANTTHTIAVTSVAGSSNFLIGAQVKPTNGFVSVTNAGVGGARAFEFDFPGGNQWFSPFTVATKFNTDAILIGFGINESRTTIPAVPNYRDSLLALITTAQTAAIDVLLEAPHSPSLDGQPGSYANSPTTAAFQQYLSVVYDVADTKDVPVLDMTDRFGLFIQASANGLTYDALHLNPAGYRAKAMSWAGLLIPN